MCERITQYFINIALYIIVISSKNTQNYSTYTRET